MTFNEIQLDLYRRLGYDSSPAANVTTRLNAFINQAHKDIIRTPGMEHSRFERISFSTTASNENLYLPDSVSQIVAAVDTTNDRVLERVPTSQILNLNPGTADEGEPEVYAIRARTAVNVGQPTTATKSLWVDSTSASDTAVAHVSGIRTGGGQGNRVSDSVTMTGTTGVQIGTHTDWLRVDRFYLTAAAVGTVTLLSGGDTGTGTVISTIDIGMTYARYLRVTLYPVPASAYTIRFDVLLSVPDMTVGTDEPWVPDEFHHLLVVGALKKEYERREDIQRTTLAQAEFEEGINHLRYYLHSRPDNVPTRSRLRSQLGSNFPPGS